MSSLSAALVPPGLVTRAARWRPPERCSGVAVGEVLVASAAERAVRWILRSGNSLGCSGGEGDGEDASLGSRRWDSFAGE